MYRKLFVAEQPEDLTIQLPDDYLYKAVEVIAFEVAPHELDNKKKEEALAFFKSISVDMSNFKFNRDEANER